jgi:hypothetical protein
MLRHTPEQPRLRRVLPWLAEMYPDAFNAYQQTQGKIVEERMKKAQYVAAFIGHSPGSAMFVGLYRRCGESQRTADALNTDPACQTLVSYGLSPETKTRLWFDLRPVETFYPDWKGKLIIKWPPKDITWHRFANRYPFILTTIHAESLLSKQPPASYREWDLQWDELRLLPESWKAKLRDWCGIYYIFDVSDGKGYVGKASGGQNLLGRWLNYADSGDGGNVKLRGRDPLNFRFSILELIPGDMEDAEVEPREQNWMLRLRTRTHTHGLNLPELDY